MVSFRSFVIACLSLIVLSVYLFITAPVPLLEENKTGKLVPVKAFLALLESENVKIRALYTRKIVGEGKKQGIKFDEDWHEESVIAGLLPAQFLRETARIMERKKMQIGLYLGSDYAINKANQLEGEHLKTFKLLKADREEKFNYFPDTERYTYMFPDIATVKPCVKCHNKHPDTPKKNWQLNDVMGVTTWTFPDSELTIDEVLTLLDNYHDAIQETYKLLLSEISTMNNPPEIGDNWPEAGYFLPNEENFMHKVRLITAPVTLTRLTRLMNPSDESVIEVVSNDN